MMKRLIIIPIIVTMVCVSCQTDSPKTSDATVATFDELAGMFSEPPAEYRPAPLWVWNTVITRELLDASLNDLKDRGFGGVFIHPRPGLVTEYISDEWFDLCRHAVNTGKQLGMYVWIYDENSYPSGFAGGHVPAQMPESNSRGKSLMVDQRDTFPDVAPENLFVCYKKENDVYREIPSTDYASERGKRGEYFLLTTSVYDTSPWYGGYSYVDLLYPGVTEKFIEITIDGYKRVLGDEFGKTVPGWFTDEPNINPHGGIRWTPDLFDVFRKRWGYDLKENLPSLFAETGEWKRVRHNYTQTLLQMFIDRFAKVCYEYCEANNLIFTGHYWEHGWPDMSEGGDNMAMYAWHQMPGIDMLFNQFNSESPWAQFGNVRSVKELASAANQTGRRRTLSETYGGGGWEETFRDFKRLGDWEYALGVNFMNQHLTHLSIAGARKYDYPPVFSAHSPWWRYYGDLNDYFARLSMTLSSGEQLNDLLIIEPTTSIWMYYAYRYSNPTYAEIGKTFQLFVTALEKGRIEYDLGSENIIKDRGSVRKKKFVVGEREYSKVFIPPMTENLDASTFALLKKFVAAGGILLSYARPSYVDGKPDDEICKFFADPDKVVFLEPYHSILDAVRSPEITFTSAPFTDFHHHRRIMNDGQILFLANVSLTEYARGTVALQGADAIELHAPSGKLRDYPETVQEGYVSLNFDIPPAGSLLLYILDKKRSGYASPPDTTSPKVETVSATPLVVTPDTDNVLTIDFCDLTLGNERFGDLHVFDASDKAFRHHGFESGNPWNTSVQYKRRTVERDTFSTGGFVATYRFTVAAPFDFSEMQAVVEHPEMYEITLNGKPVKPTEGAWRLDSGMGVCPVGAHVKTGENRLVLKLSPMKVHAEIEPVYIRGKFRVTPAAKGWTLNPPVEALVAGSWKAQGMPFYSDAVTYTKRYDIADTTKRHFVCLDEWNGTVAEVLVNGRSAGTISVEPYSIDVSGLLRKGENTVAVKVVGSNKNLLGPFHNNPEPGIVGPWHFRNVKKYPSGKDYHQLDYGLMKDFSVKTD